MKRNHLQIFCLGLLSLTFINCGSTEDPLECPPQFTGDLAESETKLVGEWTLIALVSDTEVDLTNDFTDNPSTNMFAQYSDCSKDAVFKFSTNRSYAYETGSKTDACNKNTTSGTWKLDSDELFLVVACGGLSSNLSFNEANTIFEYTNTVDIQEVNGVVTTAEVTYTYSKD